jgi:copper chaperone NosL
MHHDRGLLLVLSLLVPFWTITLHAPQYPGGLVVDAYAWKLAGDVSEVDGLNHYIGMMALGDAGALERTLAPFAIPVIAVLAVASHWLRGRKRWLAVAPAIAFPIVFVADLFAWLYHAGHSLDPTAALSSSIKPFTPRLLGEGHIGQFSTVANFSYGFYLVLVAVLVIVAATLLGRSADAREQ